MKIVQLNMMIILCMDNAGAPATAPNTIKTERSSAALRPSHSRLRIVRRTATVS